MSSQFVDGTGRTRSEYLLADAASAATAAIAVEGVRPVRSDDRHALAELMLSAYRGTIDDEGEGENEALAAIDHYFATMEGEHSFVCERDERLVTMSLVVIVDGRHYIDPVATAAALKGQGLGKALVLASLRSLVGAGVTEVGATITDGNRPSERLFTGFGFRRAGAWG